MIVTVVTKALGLVVVVGLMVMSWHVREMLRRMGCSETGEVCSGEGAMGRQWEEGMM